MQIIVGAYPKIGEIGERFSRCMAKRRVSFWGLERWVTIFGGKRNLTDRCKMTCTHTSQPKPGIQFHYRGCPFSKNRKKFYLSRGLRYLIEIWQANSTFLNRRVTKLQPGGKFPTLSHFEKSRCCHNAAADRPITTKFKRQYKNRK